MNGPSSRRGFLRGLTTLPLIGNPTRAAEPVTEDLLWAYNEWLFYERRMLCIEHFGREGARAAEKFVPHNGSSPASQFHFPPSPGGWEAAPKPSTRAAVVLSAVGCDWKER